MAHAHLNDCSLTGPHFMNQTEYIKSIMTKTRDDSMFKSQGFLSSGSTLLNLACTGTIEGAWPIGSYSLVIGDSTSGKTFFAMTTLAEASLDKRFDDYKFVYDGPEGGMQLDVEHFFGKRVAERLEPPSYDEDDEPVFSSTIESFYYHVSDLLEKGEPIIYLLDSLDCLTSDVEESKFQDRKKAHKSGRDISGSFGDGKAKVNSSHMRSLMEPLRMTNSILIVLVQTRDSFSMFADKTHAGGKSLKFYAMVEVWMSVREKITKTIKKKKRQVGVLCKTKVTKSRVTGRERIITVPILHSCGVDNLGSCCDYLVGEGVWVKKGQRINTNGFFEEPMLREKIIKKIEDEDLEDSIVKLVGETWKDIEKSCEVSRKKRYN